MSTKNIIILLYYRDFYFISPYPNPISVRFEKFPCFEMIFKHSVMTYET